jgi:hypothetical protein
LRKIIIVNGVCFGGSVCCCVAWIFRKAKS